MGTIHESRPPRTSATLSLKRKGPAPADAAPPVATEPKPEPLPLDSSVAYVNWRRGYKRPTFRFSTPEGAFAKARRLRALFPTDDIFTFRLERIEESLIEPAEPAKVARGR